MRYFTHNGNWADTDALKRRYADLSHQVQRQRRIGALMHKLGTAVFVLVGLGIFVLLLFLIRLWQPEETDVFLQILNWFADLGSVLFALIISAIVGAIAAAPFWGKHEKSEKQLMRQVLNNACRELRAYYGFCEPFLVTKCYQSSDWKFDRHDVCLFVAEDELRITANLHYGFFDPRKDLGCYAMTPQELRLRETTFKDRPAVELQAGDVTFCLGCRAKAFIKEYLNR